MQTGASTTIGERETVLGGELFLADGGKGANQAEAAGRAGAEVRSLTTSEAIHSVLGSIGTS